MPLLSPPRAPAAAALGVALVLAAAATGGGGRVRAAGLEAAVKANYLYKFAPFVEWPPRSFPTPSAPLVVCVLGEDPFGPDLDEAVRGQTVEGRAIRIRRAPGAAGAGGCHVAFVGRRAQPSPQAALAELRGAPVLTVVDEGVDASGAVVRFVIRDGRVRFALDLASAAADGLAISSKLQALAVPDSRLQP